MNRLEYSKCTLQNRHVCKNYQLRSPNGPIKTPKEGGVNQDKTFLTLELLIEGLSEMNY